MTTLIIPIIQTFAFRYLSPLADCVDATIAPNQYFHSSDSDNSNLIIRMGSILRLGETMSLLSGYGIERRVIEGSQVTPVLAGPLRTCIDNSWMATDLHGEIVAFCNKSGFPLWTVTVVECGFPATQQYGFFYTKLDSDSENSPDILVVSGILPLNPDGLTNKIGSEYAIMPFPYRFVLFGTVFNWIASSAFMFALLSILSSIRSRRLRAIQGRCLCGYPRIGLICPECGRSYREAVSSLVK